MLVSTIPAAGFETFDLSTGNDVLDASVAANNIYWMTGIYQAAVSSGDWCHQQRVRLGTAPDGSVDCFGATAGTIAAGSTKLTAGHAYSRELTYLDSSTLTASSATIGGARMYVSDNGGVWAPQVLYNRVPTDWSGQLFYVPTTYFGVGDGPIRYNPAGDGKWLAQHQTSASASFAMGDIVVASLLNRSQRLWMRSWMVGRLAAQYPN